MLERAIDASIPVLEAAWNVYAASAGDAAARIELDRLLPDGSIDGPGLDVDLDVPFQIAQVGGGPMMPQPNSPVTV